MDAFWAYSEPDVLRAHPLRDALQREGPCPNAVHELEKLPNGTFQGGMLHTVRAPLLKAVIICFHGGALLQAAPARIAA